MRKVVGGVYSWTAIALLASARVDAQAVGWHGQGALSGNIFFGNNPQLLVSTRLAAEHVDSALQNRNELRFNYGQATNNDTQNTFVTKRSWLATTSLDIRPFARVNPFVQGALESSLEKQIGLRYSAGGGARLNFVRKPQTEVVLSLGALVEATRGIDSAGVRPPTTTLARGVTSFRVKRSLGTRMVFTSESMYQPALKSFDEYTFATDNAVIVTLRKSLSFTVSMRDSYDSQARSRGARHNNDGDVLFGVLATF